MRKKNTILILCPLILIIMISGCGGQSEEQSESQSERKDRQYEDFKEFFDGRMEALQEQYTVTTLPDVDMENGEVVHVIRIKDNLIDDDYSIHVTCNKEDQIQTVLLSTERKTYGNLAYALFSKYLYDAMVFPEIEADDFYEKYNLFTEDDLFVTDVVEEGWEIAFFTTEDLTTFRIGEPVENE